MSPQEIKHRLKAKRLTQQALAKRLGVSRTSVSFLVHGQMVSERLQKRFARALGVTVEDLRSSGEGQAA